MDTVRYLMYRRAGGTDGLLSWEFAPVESWNQAPEAGLYKPIWEYDRATLARNLTSHLADGASTGAAFCAVARI
jgi:hypothetical protein